MSNLRRYSLGAVVLLVVLRLSIGWQLLYEGLWKIDTLSTPKPWSSVGYLKNSVGPLRDQFRELAGDPNDLKWLDYDTVSARWVDWAERFKNHYRLDEKQARTLKEQLHGRATVDKKTKRSVFAQPLEKLPEGIEKLNVSSKVVWFDAAAKRIYVDADRMLTPSEKQKLESLVKDRNDEESAAYLKAVAGVYDRQKKTMGYLKKLAGAVRGNPDLLGNKDWQRLGELDQYRQELEQYEKDYAAATTSFERDHLAYQWKKLQSKRAELSGPIKAMEAELQESAVKMLTVPQQARGPVSKPWTALRISDTLTILGLTILGSMLILGLFTRFAAVMAAFMLFGFYMAMPPWPGVPEIPGPEHSFIVNKNLIEVIALLALATVPSGMWFGLDRLLAAFFAQWKADGKSGKALKSTVATGDEPTGPEIASA